MASIEKKAQDDLEIFDENRGPGDYVKEKYDEALKGVGNKLWDGMLQVAASGFGKGLIVGALILIGISTMGGGLLAATVGINVGQAALVTTFEGGIAAGFASGIALLPSVLGAIAMAGGGIMGAVMDMRKEQTKISATQAEVLARQYAQSRGQSPQQALGAEPDRDGPPPSHVTPPPAPPMPPQGHAPQEYAPQEKPLIDVPDASRVTPPPAPGNAPQAAADNEKPLIDIPARSRVVPPPMPAGFVAQEARREEQRKQSANERPR